MTKDEKKIVVAMSGGVDSSVTASLLVEQGYQVQGVFMALAQPDFDEQVGRVKKIADFLHIPLHVVDLVEPFHKEVLEYFCASYSMGKTPNPCVVCNPKVKFGRLLSWATDHGIRLLATGHYVRLLQRPDEPVVVLKGADPKKDQSYFLCRLSQDQIKRLRFPLGEMEKTQVYERAAQLGLSTLHGQESQDVCFLGDTNIQEFLEQSRGLMGAPGDFVTIDGRVVGRHNGLIHYTVGQRRGLGIPDATPYYVVGLDVEQNRVVIGKEADLYGAVLMTGPMNWMAGEAPELPGYFTVKIRYRHGGAQGMVEPTQCGVRIRFDKAQRAITPGQFAVLYREEELIGGGEILPSSLAD